MKEGRTSPVRRRGLGVLAAVAIVGAVPVLARSLDRAETLRRTGEATRQAADANHRAAGAWAAEVEALLSAAEKASQKKQLAAAVRAGVDGATITDLMSSEPWWEPYRRFIATLSFDGR